ncbi:MAG: PH domain-containing protein [Acidimicrobiales bacterium]
MPFDRQLLADDEEVMVDTRLHWLPLAGPTFVALLALAGAIAIGVTFPGAPVAVTWVLAAMVGLPALWLAGRVLRWRGVRLVVTTGRIVYRRGVLGRDVVQLRLQRVAEVHCTQTLRGRLIGCGRLVLEVDGGESMVVDDVRRPRALQRLIAAELDEAWYGSFGDGWGGRTDPARRRPPAPCPPQGSPQARVPAAPITAPMTAPTPVGMRQAPIDVRQTPPHGIEVPPFAHTTVLPAVPAAPPTGAAATIPEQLIALDDLRKRGIITAQEFHAKKAELLSRL